jgi:hypothetical protein
MEHHRPGPDGRVPIPDRLGWWAQLTRERVCRRLHGHCFHPHLFTFWNCCMCGGTVEGFPKFRCNHCERGNR